MHAFTRLMTALLSLGLLLTYSIAQSRGAEKVLQVNPKATTQRLSGAGSTFAAPVIKEWMRVYGLHQSPYRHQPELGR